MKVIDEKTGSLLVARVRTADSVAERTRGLIGTRALADDEGMFFPDCRMIHTFFMSMRIDVVFLDGENEVLDVFPDLKPWRIAFCRQPGGRSTLELASGRVAGLGIEVGNRFKLEFE